MAQDDHLDIRISGLGLSEPNAQPVDAHPPAAHDQPAIWSAPLLPDMTSHFPISLGPELTSWAQNEARLISAEQEFGEQLSECISSHTFSLQPYQEALRVHYPSPASTLHDSGPSDMLDGDDDFSLLSVADRWNGNAGIAGWGRT